MRLAILITLIALCLAAAIYSARVDPEGFRKTILARRA